MPLHNLARRDALTAGPLRALSRLLTVLVVAFAAAAATAAEPSVLVHQFDSQDVLLGAALAAEVADALEESAVVIGPEVAAAAVPPIVVEGGFINPVRVVDPRVMFGPAGADLLQGSTGVDLAVTGRLEERDDRLSLFVYLRTTERTRSAELTAEPSEPGRLALLAAALIGSELDRLDPDGAPHYRRPSAVPDLAGGMAPPYGDYARAIALASAGLIGDAQSAIGRAAGEPGVPERASRILEDLWWLRDDPVEGEPDGAAVDEGSPAPDAESLLRRAIFSMQSNTDVARSNEAFRAAEQATGLAFTRAWEGALAASVNDRAGADAAYDAAAAYGYGAAARATFQRSRGERPDGDALEAMVGDPRQASSAALLAAALSLELAGEPDAHVAALEALHSASPFLAYPLEALSYHYFDEDDGRAAAEVLGVAVELEPDSDLYWTNLGWAYYLVNALALSEEASLMALSLDGTQSVAAYNLGLVRAVTGRLEEAMPAYEQALRFDPDVNDEAIEDLQNALELHPGVPDVYFALGHLLEADGRRQEAREAFRSYVALGSGPLVAEAEDRLAVLERPLPPMEVVGDVRLALGARGPESDSFHPGDPVHPTFELSTQGDSLPTRVDVRVELRPAGEDGDPLLWAEETIDVPPGAVGFVVDQVEIALPEDLAAGTYLVSVSADGGEDQSASAEVEVSVDGEPEAIRQLVGRGIVMTDLQAGQPLYSARDIAQPQRLVDVLLAELRFAASAAQEALPVVEGGRFDGMGGGELFQSSTDQDVRDFLEYVLTSGSAETRFAFVDAYAQWALDGAPEAP